MKNHQKYFIARSNNWILLKKTEHENIIVLSGNDKLELVYICEKLNADETYFEEDAYFEFFAKHPPMLVIDALTRQ